jgi:hypothetical protein
VSSDLRELVARIQARGGNDDPATLALVARVTIDATALQARAIAGENVESELAIVAATARNLDHSVRQVISAEVSAWTQGLLARALGIVVVGGF